MLSNGQFVEYFFDYKVFNFGEVIDRPLELHSGRLELPTEPGFGYTFCEDKIKHLEADEWR